jgi:hypothetical protein
MEGQPDGQAEGRAGGGAGVTTALRRLWLVGAALLAVGLLLPGGGAILAAPALLLLALSAGTTAARGRTVGTAWRWLSWAVPVVPTLVLAGFVLWLLDGHSDPMAVVLVVYVVGSLVLMTWGVFLLALLVDLLRRNLSSVRRGRSRVEE